jgi:hypothetical protein
MPAFFSKRDELVHCFRTGLGLTYDAMGTDCACGTHRELVSTRGLCSYYPADEYAGS